MKSRWKRLWRLLIYQWSYINVLLYLYHKVIVCGSRTEQKQRQGKQYWVRHTYINNIEYMYHSVKSGTHIYQLPTFSALLRDSSSQLRIVKPSLGSALKPNCENVKVFQMIRGFWLCFSYSAAQFATLADHKICLPAWKTLQSLPPRLDSRLTAYIGNQALCIISK